ncbi:Lysophospholipase L1 [Agromyces sp. CF514]|uniref:SGNH/GDSL hydrolase family protein n=1 Tax=Agromyces sp. CF514 TaxID=1881031 RepID=UPI0008F2BA2F|nr:GDSL-type esterase/lipase family protein [Agromyces sp. CF514]SFR72338.1 Lysophospholipase L1 [Agromyces sp. CF514]
MTRTTKALAAATVVLAALALAACTPSAAAPPDLADVEQPASAPSVATLGILGDSVSLGVNACAEPGQCAQASWSGGSDPAVGSVAARLAAASGTEPDVVNAAKDGGDVEDALGLADEVVAAQPELVTVLLGGNDACAPTLDEMTPAADYESRLGALLTKLNTEVPGATVLVLSVPDLHHLWEIGRTDASAVQAWNSSPSCKNLLGSADDDSAAADERRDAVAARVVEYNEAIVRVCAAAERCIDDEGAVYAYPFEIDEISSIDHFHPSVAGQRVIAEIAWQALEKGGADG